MSQNPPNPSVYFHDQLGEKHRVYHHPRAIIRADNVSEVLAAFTAMQRAKSAGYYLAGYCAYEVGAILEGAVLSKTRGENIPNKSPLILFGVYDAVDTNPPKLTTKKGRVSSLKPNWNYKTYAQKFDRVKAYIGAGDVYQINLTFGMEGQYDGDGFGLYQQLQAGQPVQYGGVINLADTSLVSLSPELFFTKKGQTISLRPMKGTCARGNTKVEDAALALALSKDNKNCAENLMIVDLLRNDVSRLAKAGSVRVTDLFSVETYPSLHTMTSGITAEVEGDPDILDIFKALFPCGSVTGAPKIRAQQIIAELEKTPRGPYCGACGWIDPNGDMEFNVAIRTAVLRQGNIRYAIGSGVVYDSNVRDEYDECLLKAQIITDLQLPATPDFNLIETMGWSAQTGLMHLDLHCQRLRASASALGFEINMNKCQKALAQYCSALDGTQAFLVRLELSPSGDVSFSHRSLDPKTCFEIWPIVISKNTVQSGLSLAAHKTTKRDFFEAERERLLDNSTAQEVIFLNAEGQICEGSITNIFIQKDNVLLTPPQKAGCLPGILREVLIQTGQAKEAELSLSDLRDADQIFIGNSARGLMRARLISQDQQ